jgi:hypothetical protein
LYCCVERDIEFKVGRRSFKSCKLRSAALVLSHVRAAGLVPPRWQAE